MLGKKKLDYLHSLKIKINNNINNELVRTGTNSSLREFLSSSSQFVVNFSITSLVHKLIRQSIGFYGSDTNNPNEINTFQTGFMGKTALIQKPQIRAYPSNQCHPCSLRFWWILFHQSKQPCT